MGKAEGPTFLGCRLVVLLTQQVARALREERQARHLDQGRDGDGSKQVRPGALLEGEEGPVSGGGGGRDLQLSDSTASMSARHVPQGCGGA